MIGAGASVAGVLAALVVTASPAEAMCINGQSETLSHHYNGHIVAQERITSGTCNGNGTYTGQLKDTYTDGYSAAVRFKDGSFNEVVAYSSGDWKTYTFTDKNGGSAASMMIYSSPDSRPDWWYATSGY